MPRRLRDTVADTCCLAVWFAVCYAWKPLRSAR